MPSYLILTSITNQAELLNELTHHLGTPLTQVSTANEPESTLTIEQVRDMLSTTNYAASASTTPLAWLLWNIHTSSIPAQNALLKVVEEPPTNVSFFLITPSLENVLDTIQSRCTIITVADTTPQTATAGETAQNSAACAKTYATICSGTIPELIELADTWKTVEEATAQLKQLISWLRNSAAFPSKLTTNHLRLLTEAHAALFANANLKLTLEHCFFEMKMCSNSP